MDRVKGKVALVTGGASGIGRASAQLLAKEGAVVVVTDVQDDMGKDCVAAVKKAGEAFGLTLPLEACRFSAEKTRTAFWLGPDEWMLQDIDAEASVLMGDLERALGDEPHSLVDVSHRSDAFVISGERSAYLLNHGCPLDLSLEAFPVGMCTRTIFAKAAILLSRPDRHTFHLDLWRSYAPYVWELLDEARSEFA